MVDYEIGEIRRIRREISARFDHDVRQTDRVTIKQLEKEYRKSGKYKFVEPPSEKPEKEAKSKNGEAAD